MRKSNRRSGHLGWGVNVPCADSSVQWRPYSIYQVDQATGNIYHLSNAPTGDGAGAWFDLDAYTH